MTEPISLAEHRQQVEQDMATMRAAVAEAQQATVKRGVQMSYIKDGKTYSVLPTEIQQLLSDVKEMRN